MAETSLKFSRLGTALLIDGGKLPLSEIQSQFLKTIVPLADFFEKKPVFIKISSSATLEKLEEIADKIQKNTGASVYFISENHADSVSRFLIKKDELPVISHDMLGTEWVFRNIRCGQEVEFAGNVVIMGDVNAGAIVRAGGNICIVGVLRGIVHAGFRDNDRALVIAARFLPSQIRISRYVGRSPDEAVFESSVAEVAYVEGERIVIEEYKDVLLNRGF